MKKFLNISLSVCFIFLGMFVMANPNLSGRDKNTETEFRKLPPFTGIIITGSVDVILRQGDNQEIKVEADHGLAGRIKTEVNGKTLEISNPGTFRMVKILRVYVTVPAIDEIKLTGSGDLQTEGTFKCNTLEFNIHGSGDLELRLDAGNVTGSVTGSGDASVSGIRGTLDLTLTGSGDVSCRDLQLSRLKLEVNGSGDVKMSGQAERIAIGHYSSGDIDLVGLKTQDADIEQRGSGDCSVFVANNLNVSNSGSGDIYISGNPQKRRASSHGSGDIHYN